MSHKLCENIKKYRKEKSFTQELLAEAMGVSVGTVSKWENGNCIPDISMIMELADFFEISVDVLVGYNTPLKKVPDILERIQNHFKKHELDEAIMECSKALVKYPNNFDLIMITARIRFVMWYETGKDNYRQQAKDLYQKAQLYIPEDEKKSRNNFTILHNLAQLETDKKKKIQLLEEINFNGTLDAEIGEVYRDDKNIEKAYEYLSEGLYLRSLEVMNVIGRWLDPLIREKKFDTALYLADYEEMILKSIYNEDEISIGTKLLAHMELVKAVIYEILSDHAKMKYHLKNAIKYAKAFDESPAYAISAGSRLWLCKTAQDAPLAVDDQGPLAMKAIEGIINDFKTDYGVDEKIAAENVHNELKLNG